MSACIFSLVNILSKNTAIGPASYYWLVYAAKIWRYKSFCYYALYLTFALWKLCTFRMLSSVLSIENGRISCFISSLRHFLFSTNICLLFSCWTLNLFWFFFLLIWTLKIRLNSNANRGKLRLLSDLNIACVFPRGTPTVISIWTIYSLLQYRPNLF